MLNGQKRTKRKIAKRIQNFKFLYSFNNFGREPPQKYTWILGSKPGDFLNSLNNFGKDPPQEYAWFLRVNLCILSEEMSFEILSPTWSHVNENEKKIVKKNKKLKNVKNKNSSGDMVGHKN